MPHRATLLFLPNDQLSVLIQCFLQIRLDDCLPDETGSVAAADGLRLVI